jgi:hypothetical protein
MTKDYNGLDPSQHLSEWPPLDIQAFLDGDLQGRENVVLSDDRLAVEEYAKQWRIPAWDYFRRRDARDAKQYDFLGSCPRCGSDGTGYSPPFKDNWMVCSSGCRVRWLVGAGLFSPPPMGELPKEKLREIVEKLFREYAEVEPLFGWKAEELLIDPHEADVAIRLMKLDDVGGCAICGFDAIPEDLRKLANRRLLGTLFDSSFVPRVLLLSLAHGAPLCMVCGEEVSRSLQEVVNGLWGLGKGPSGPCRKPH